MITITFSVFVLYFLVVYFWNERIENRGDISSQFVLAAIKTMSKLNDRNDRRILCFIILSKKNSSFPSCCCRIRAGWGKTFKGHTQRPNDLTYPERYDFSKCKLWRLFHPTVTCIFRYVITIAHQTVFLKSSWTTGKVLYDIRRRSDRRVYVRVLSQAVNMCNNKPWHFLNADVFEKQNKKHLETNTCHLVLCLKRTAGRAAGQLAVGFHGG